MTKAIGRTVAGLALAAAVAFSGVSARADVSASEDWLMGWEGGENWLLDVGEWIGFEVDVDSGSPATVSVAGLPPGVSFNSRTRKVSGAPTKRGVYYVTFSAKNKNGYTYSWTDAWNVGYASNGDYDDIGIDWDNLYNYETDSPVEWQTGDKVYFSLWESFADSDLAPTSVAGLPPTLSAVKCSPHVACGYTGDYYGTLTKAGKYKITVTAKPWDGGVARKAVKTIIVRDSGCRYLNVSSPEPWRGSATGSKVYSLGAKARISAKAASGYRFAGWYLDANFSEPLYDTASGDWRKASDSVVVTEELAETGIFARFVSSYEDDIYIDCDDTWNVETSYDDMFWVDVSSETLPTVTAKGLPPGVTWDKSLFAFVSNPYKLKPGTSVATITAKNLSGRTATKTVRIVVPNIQSWVFDGLDYSSDAYNVMVGVSDACVMGWVNFEFDSSYRVTASGLPPGLRLETYDGCASVMGTPTKAGVYTVTLTAKSGSYAEKATFTINVKPLPDYAIGTFNGVLMDDDDNIVGSFTFTAAANGRQSVKVVTEQGTMSLSAPAWNCFYATDVPMAYFYKYSATEDFYFTFVPGGSSWNCEHQLTGGLTWSKYMSYGESEMSANIYSAQRNPFAKAGSSYEHPVAARVANALASEYASMKMVLDWDSDRQAYRLECADCVESEWGFDGTATLKMNKNGTATLSGKVYGIHNFTSSVPLVFNTACGDFGARLYGEHCYAIFTPVVKERVCTDCCGGEYGCSMVNTIVPIYWFPLWDY